MTVFAKSMQAQEEALRLHMQTDADMARVKRQILLKVLKKIRETPPQFLTNPQLGQLEHNLEELDRTIADLERILQS